MNYQKIYNSLIAKAQQRKVLDAEYYEKHHIKPRCLGGDDTKDNLVSLTAREHFIAHLCLVKMFPGHTGLIKAAVMMTYCVSTTQQRVTNRTYQWLKEQHSRAMSEQSSGKNNSQFGTCWVFDRKTRIEKKISRSELEYYIKLGWYKGRSNTHFKTCVVCNKEFSGQNHRNKKTCSDECYRSFKFEYKVFEGREKEFLNFYKDLKSMNKALKAMGFKGAVSHYYQWAKSILEKNNLGV